MTEILLLARVTVPRLAVKVRLCTIPELMATSTLPCCEMMLTEGALTDAPTQRDPYFKLDYCTRCPGAPDSILQPATAWKDAAAYGATAKKLAVLFRENLNKYASPDLPAVQSAGP